jgi:hypothetical protein
LALGSIITDATLGDEQELSYLDGLEDFWIRKELVQYLRGRGDTIDFENEFMKVYLHPRMVEKLKRGMAVVRQLVMIM